MKKIIVCLLLSLSVLAVVYWLGIQVAYLYLYHTLAISFDTGLLFFTGRWDYFLLLSGIALYFILDIIYNTFIRRSKKGKNRKRGLTRYEKNNYKHLAHLHEAKKGLTRLEFDVSGHLCNIDYAKPEILIGQILAVYILRQIIRVIYQLFLAAKSAVTVYIGSGAADAQSNMYLAVSGKTGMSILLSIGLFVFCGYVFALLHQDWTQFDSRTMVDRLMKLHLRDYCDDVFDTPKQYWNRQYTPYQVWKSYRVLDDVGDVDEPDLKTNVNALTNMLQIIRFAYGKNQKLTSIFKGYSQRFSLYCGQAQRVLSDDQKGVMKQIGDYVINDGAITVNELNEIDTDLWRKGVLSFGVPALTEEMNTMSRFVLRA